MFRAPFFRFVFSRQHAWGRASAPHRLRRQRPRPHQSIFTSGQYTSHFYIYFCHESSFIIYDASAPASSDAIAHDLKKKKKFKMTSPQKRDESGLIMAQSLPLDLLTFNLTQVMEIKKFTCNGWQMKKLVLPLLCWMGCVFMMSTALSLPRTFYWCGELVRKC